MGEVQHIELIICLAYLILVQELGQDIQHTLSG